MKVDTISHNFLHEVLPLWQALFIPRFTPLTTTESTKTASYLTLTTLKLFLACCTGELKTVLLLLFIPSLHMRTTHEYAQVT